MRAKRLRFVAVVLAAFLGAEVSPRAQAPGGTATQDEIATAPVELDGASLFRVRGVTSYPAETRARLIRDRIIAAAGNASVAADSIRAVDRDGVTRILAGDALIMTVLDVDGEVEQIPRTDLARVIAAQVQAAIVAYREARSAGALRRDALSALEATVVLLIAVVLLQLFWRWIDRFLVRRLQTRITNVGIQSFELLRAERIWDAVRGVILAIRTAVFLLIGLAYLGFVLAAFPWTRGLSQNMVEFALGPLKVIGGGIVANIPSLVFLTVLYFAVRLVLRLVKVFFDSVSRGGVRLRNFEPEWAEPTYKLLRTAIVAFAIIVGYPYIPGSQSDAFKGVSLFIGIVFSLGSSSAISNVIAGYMMTYRRAFKVGDRIKVGDAFGEVIETRLQVTHLRSVKNEEIIIPNSQILSAEVCNYSTLTPKHGLILHTEVGIGYETPWRQVEAMLLESAGRTWGLSREPPPFVLEKKLGDFAVVYELNVFCHDIHTQSLAKLYAELHRHILDVFNEYGVQIMTPAYEGDPAEPKVVPRKDWYTAPAASTQAKAIEPVRRGG